MKKILCMTGTIAIISSALGSIAYSRTTNTFISKKTIDLDSPVINWNEVKVDSGDLFKELKTNNQKLKQTYAVENLNFKEEVSILQVIDYAEKESQKIYKRISR